MMRLTLVLAALPLLLPATTAYGQGYVLPETVLEENDAAFVQPSHKRGAEWNAQLESELSRQRHPVIYSDPGDRESWESTEKTPPLPPEPPLILEEEEVIVPEEDEGQASYDYGIDPLTARLLERLARDQLIRAALQPVLPSTAAVADAPLAGPGPAAILSVIAMGLASVWTLRRARGLEKFIHGM